MAGFQEINVEFGELNTELPFWRLESGDADIALNVVVREGRLQKRAGFSRDDETVDTARMIQGPDGNLYTRTVAGWFYVWAGRVYFNAATGSVYSLTGDFATTKKAGLPRPAAGFAVAAFTGGRLEGEYHVHWTYYNSSTGEESVLSLPQASYEPLQTRASDGRGGIAISSLQANADYTYDKRRIYLSRGASERVLSRTPSFHVYLSQETASTSLTAIGSSRFQGDRDHPHHPNAGGEPPASTVGCFDGSQAVYCVGTSGEVEFSLPGFPTMVPRQETYTASGSGWSYTAYVEPEPWRGEMQKGLPAAPVAAAAGAGRIVICTAGAMVEMVRREDGRLFPRQIHNAGCSGAQGIIGTPHAIHVLGGEAWYVIGPESSPLDTSYGHWTPTIDAISSPSACVVAHFSYLHQVWLADGSSIYIIDDRSGLLLGKFTVAGLGTVKAMCEFTSQTANPVMKVASTTGTWTYDPDSTTQTDDNETGFAAQWQGYVRVAQPGTEATLLRVTFDISANTPGEGTGLQLSAGVLRSETETFTDNYFDCSGTGVTVIGAPEMSPYYRGEVVRIKVASESNGSSTWKIDLIRVAFDTEREG
ncbi:MAG TPA: hypothetical protein VM487_23705 [Phycisphaerae bacterium]|nr:hypothetical protein [Phycisphaerae bacterium]